MFIKTGMLLLMNKTVNKQQSCTIPISTSWTLAHPYFTEGTLRAVRLGCERTHTIK